MNAWTCTQVQDEIELYAAGECDLPARVAIERHLADCPACNAALDEAREMLGLLTLKLREPVALARLQRCLAADVKKQRRPGVLVFVIRASAFAAVLLLTVGLYLWFKPDRPDGRGGNLPAAVAQLQAVGPDTVYRVRGTHEVELERGELLVDVPAQKAGQAFVVATPAGKAQATDGTFVARVSQGTEPAVAVSVLRGKLDLSNAKGTTTVRPGETAAAQGSAAPVRQVENLALRFGRVYEPLKVQGTAKVPPYALPVDPAALKSYKAVGGYLSLKGAEPLLRKNGFAVVPDRRFSNLLAPYADLTEHHVPAVITADTLLHLYRLQLSATLRDVEEREFAGDLLRLTQALAAQVAANKDPALAPARELALTYLGVGLRLQQPGAPLPGGTNAADVAAIVKAVEAGANLESMPGLGYGADFADFRPVGHYTRLPRYYRAMLWFGRMPLFLGGGQVSEEQARRQTQAAGLIAEAVAAARLEDGRRALEVWRRIEIVTAYYVGLADTPGPVQYAAALQGVSLDRLAQPGGQVAFRQALASYVPLPPFADVARSPRTPHSLDDLVARLDRAAGFRLFGQRFAPDAYALSKLVYPKVGPRGSGKAELRGLPHGLDLMAVLGSGLARQLLNETGDDAFTGVGNTLSYGEALTRLRGEFARFDRVDWNANLYWSWLYTLQPLLQPPGNGYPTCMTTPAYEARLLTTALASWAQLRRDTVLYTKKAALPEMVEAKDGKSKTVVLPGPVRGDAPPIYLEPLPEVYARLLALTRMSRTQLTALKVLDDAGRQRLEDLERLLQRVLQLAEKELANEALDKDDARFLHDVPYSLRDLAGARDVGAVEQLRKELATAESAKDKHRTETVSMQLLQEEYGPVAVPLVATVAVDSVTGERVLQTAVGGVDLAVFVVPDGAGGLMLAVGPVLSYYEWQLPRKEEWTEERWLREWGTAQRPAWTRIFLTKS
jgi:hypothetical protein